MFSFKNFFLSGIFLFLFTTARAQSTNFSVFESIAAELKTYKIDTSDAPDDKITRKINQLRTLRGGFNIGEAVNYKIGEEKNKAGVSQEQLTKIAAYFSSGRGHQLLINAVTWIYRSEFNYAELKKLVRFYKTSAGQKLATRFPVIMLKSLAAAEIIQQNSQLVK